MKLREIQICSKCGLLNVSTDENKSQQLCKVHLWENLQDYLMRKSIEQTQQILKGINLDEKQK